MKHASVLQDFPKDEAAVSQRIDDALTRVQQDLYKVHKEGQTVIMCPAGSPEVVPDKYQAHMQVMCFLQHTVHSVELQI